MTTQHTPTPVIDGNELLTVPEVARLLRVDATSVRRWVKDGILEAVTLPHTGKRAIYRIPRSAIEALLDTTLKGVRE